MKSVSLWLILLLFGSVGVDQYSKFLVEKDLMTWEDPENLRAYRGDLVAVEKWGSEDNWYLEFNLVYVRNLGAAWGLFSDLDDVYRIPLFYIIVLFGIFWISWQLFQTPLEDRFARLALMLIISGAVGNLADRVFRGYVVDFLQFRWNAPLPWFTWQYTFPSFNWADSCICVGGLFYFFVLLQETRKGQSKVGSLRFD